MKKEIPTTKLDRGKVIIKSALNVGIKKVKRPFLSQEKKEQIDNEIGDIIFDNISLLKGTAIKLSQALALHNIIPQNMQKKLEKSYNKINPLSKALVIKTLKNEFKKEYKEVFDEFELSAFASASLGQVHRAKKDGKKLAVKVQYPSIDKTIQNDLKLLKGFSKFKGILKPIIEEVEEKLYEEIDYLKEAQYTIEAFRLFNDKDILVPKVNKKLTTKHVLTTSFIDGLDLNSWIESKPNKKDKTKIANLIYDMFLESVFKHKSLQADPNPANYIITPDTKLALIDFGCVKKFDEDFIKILKNFMHSYISNDKKTVAKIYKEVGFIKDEKEMSKKIYKNMIIPFNAWMIEPYKHDKYLFTQEYLDIGLGFAEMFEKAQFEIVKDFLFYDRTQHGLFSLFAKMEVPINMTKAKNEIYN
jgi:predicted unusual protein kinase regulating ubiquinone biosynthesis (AarF/ABC1/UbiB family)